MSFGYTTLLKFFFFVILFMIFVFIFWKVIRELIRVIISRAPKMCNFVEWRGFKVVYKRWFKIDPFIVPSAAWLAKYTKL